MTNPDARMQYQTFDDSCSKNLVAIDPELRRDRLLTKALMNYRIPNAKPNSRCITSVDVRFFFCRFNVVSFYARLSARSPSNIRLDFNLP